MKIEELIIFKVVVDEALYKILLKVFERKDVGKEIVDFVLNVESIHKTVSRLIVDIQTLEHEGDSCPLSLSSENYKTLADLQLRARKLDKDLNPIRFLFHAYEPKFWY